jgi:ATP-dependent RNA/DNA helicase IGHMBP2
MTTIHDKLQFSLKLLKQEWQEDLEQYKKKFLSASISDKKEQGVCWYPTHLKKSKYGLAGKVVVELERLDGAAQAHLFQSGKSVSIFSNLEGQSTGNRLNGIINNVRNDTMTITLHVEEVPDWLHRGKIGIDLMFDEASYREMEVTLKALMKAQKGRLGELRDILLGDRVPAFSTGAFVSEPGLNQGQQFAVELALTAHDVAIIHGPPGTGKTTTLIATILRTLKEYPQVLVCAPSNAAVDLLVEKLIEKEVQTLRIGHPARVEDHIIAQTLDARIAQHESYKDLKKLKKAAEDYRKLGLKFKRNFGAAERNQKKLLLEQASRCKEDAENLEKYITYDIFQRTQVIAATLVGAASQVLKGMEFPVVFIDEAAQGLEAATWIPILKSKKVVMAGDHCQLPPTIKSYEAAKNGLAETLFEKVVRLHPQVSQMLNLQYRMPELVMGFSSLYFYNNNLKSAPNTTTHQLVAGEPVLEFIDTAGSGFMDQVEEESLSTFNIEEAKFALRYLENTIKRIGIANFRQNSWNIGLIAPYKAQVRRFHELLFSTYEYPNLRAFADMLTIDSIDGFQGQERDLILISLVRSNVKGEIGFLSDTRRMNVAMTRAKRKLIMIGDSATLSSHPFYVALLDYMDQHTCYSSVYSYLE